VLVEYPTQPEAKASIKALDGTKLLDQTIHVDFAFVRPPPPRGDKGRGALRGAAGLRGGRPRSRSRSKSRERERSPEGGGD
jgi:RNA-binding protein 8A